jgi:hypothetical protein
LTLLAGCGGSGGDGPQDHIVQYEVSTYSTYPVSIAYIDENGDTVEIPSISITDKSWTYTFSAPGGTHLYLWAALLGNTDDIFYATIYVDYLNVNSYSQKGSVGPAVLDFTIPTE